VFFRVLRGLKSPLSRVVVKPSLECACINRDKAHLDSKRSLFQTPKNKLMTVMKTTYKNRPTDQKGYPASSWIACKDNNIQQKTNQAQNVNHHKIKRTVYPQYSKSCKTV
jgi:hypothetical protein